MDHLLALTWRACIPLLCMPCMGQLVGVTTCITAYT